MQIETLIHDKRTYPRSNINRKTIEAYKGALEIGAVFPPIKIQDVTNFSTNGEEPRSATIIVDGVHRWMAHDEAGQDEIKTISWRPEPVDYKNHWQELLIESHRCNREHGDRIKEGDSREVARTIAESDPDVKYKDRDLGDWLGYAQRTINGWVSDIRARQKASRDSVIHRLSRLGWTQGDIAEKVELDQTAISKIMNNSEFAIIHNLLEEGRDMDFIADLHHMDLALAWALRLDDKTDQERFKELGWGLRTWDDWRFTECDVRFGDDWPGRIPAQLVAHTLFYFTKPGDLVLDPMAGGGVVPDTCLAFGRRCLAFDAKARDERPEIKHHEWALDNMSWPINGGYKSTPDLIFFDPPYFTKKQKEYQKIIGSDSISISDLNRADYLSFFSRFFRLVRDHTKPGCRIAFLNADWRDFQGTPALEESEQKAITIIDYAKLLDNDGWSITHLIDCPMSSQRFNAGVVEAMQKRRILGVVRRTLIIARGV